MKIRRSLANIATTYHLLRQLKRGHLPKQLVLQLTDECNATCPQCSMRKTNDFARTKLPFLEIRKIIDAAAKNKVQSLSFTGGEVFLYEAELLQHISYAWKKGIPYIRTGTNGFMMMGWESADFYDRMNRFAERLAKTNLRNFWISIDSACLQTHEKMRGLPGVIRGIEKALPIFHAHGIYPAANLGINRNTGGKQVFSDPQVDPKQFYEQWCRSFENFYRFIIDLGFTMTNSCYPMSVDKDELTAIYGANSPATIVSFSVAEKKLIFQALLETIEEYRDQIRIFTPLSSLYALIMEYEGRDELSYPCRGGTDFFFIPAASGDTFPCGFRGEDNFGKFYELDWGSLQTNAHCKKCDWECFRDPSEMLGFLQERYFDRGWKSKKHKMPKTSLYRQLWKKDMKYYRQCDFFDGRKPMKNK